MDLLKKLEAFKDVDPAKVAELIETERKLKEKELIAKGDIEGLIAQRVHAMKTDYESKMATMTEQLGLSTRQLETLLVDNEVRAHAAKIGVAPTAVDDVLLRAKTTFKVKDGKVVSLDANGNIVYGKDGSNPLGIQDWIGGLKEQAPHLFLMSQGSGAGNKPGQPGNGAKLSATQKIAAGLTSGSNILS